MDELTDELLRQWYAENSGKSLPELYLRQTINALISLRAVCDRVANEMQSASSADMGVDSAWLDKRITRLRAGAGK